MTGKKGKIHNYKSQMPNTDLEKAGLISPVFRTVEYMLQKHNMVHIMDGQKMLSFNVFHRIYRQYIYRILVPNYFIGYICIH